MCFAEFGLNVVLDRRMVMVSSKSDGFFLEGLFMCTTTMKRYEYMLFELLHSQPESAAAVRVHP